MDECKNAFFSHLVHSKEIARQARRTGSLSSFRCLAITSSRPQSGERGYLWRERCRCLCKKRDSDIEDYHFINRAAERVRLFSGIADAQQDLRIDVANGQRFAQFGADGRYFAGLVEEGAGEVRSTQTQ